MTGASLVGNTALADGYYGPIPGTIPGSKFYYWGLDIDLAPLLNPNTSEVSITLAKGRWRNNTGACQYDIRGFTHDPSITGGTINLFRVDGTAEVQIGTATITPIGFFGKDSFSGPHTHPTISGCPTQVKARRFNNPTVASPAETLILRIDPLFDQFAL